MCVYCYIYCLESVVQQSKKILRPLEASLLIGIKVWEKCFSPLIYITSKCQGRCQRCCLCTEAVSCCGGCVVQSTRNIYFELCMFWLNCLLRKCCTAVAIKFEAPWRLHTFALILWTLLIGIKTWEIGRVFIATSIAWQVLYSSRKTI